MSNLSKELERRATAVDEPPSWKPGKKHGWTPAGIVTIVVALGGPAVIVQLVSAWVDKLAAEAEYMRRRAAVVEEAQKQLAEDIAAARKDCGNALDLANTAKSRAAAAEELAETALKRRRRED